jgi:DNA-binding IclR family transcriptional regulator
MPKPRHGIQVIARAAQVLRALEGEANGLSLGEIALRVRLPRSTVQRIVNALAAEQLVMAASPTARVRLGPGLLRLAANARLEIADIARPYIRALSERIRETVDLSILDGAEAVFIDHVVAPRRLRLVSAIGVHFPLHCTANGKAFLAALDEPHVRRLLGKRLPAYTRHTVRSLARLFAQLRAARRTGLAYDREEHTEGICAIGCLVHDQWGNLLAISVPMPTSRFRVGERAVARALLECRRKVQAVLTGQK